MCSLIDEGDGHSPSPIRRSFQQVDLTTAADHGQIDLWPNEYEGMCGV